MKRIFLINLFIIATLVVIFLLTGGCGVKKIYQKENVHLLEADSYLNKIKTIPESYVIDIRTPFEYYRGHLDSAINISYIGFDFKKQAKRLDNSRSVFIYCHTAHRSPFAAKKLYKLGFKEIFDLKYGYSSLKKGQ